MVNLTKCCKNRCLSTCLHHQPQPWPLICQTPPSLALSIPYRSTHIHLTHRRESCYHNTHNSSQYQAIGLANQNVIIHKCWRCGPIVTNGRQRKIKCTPTILDGHQWTVKRVVSPNASLIVNHLNYLQRRCWWQHIQFQHDTIVHTFTTRRNPADNRNSVANGHRNTISRQIAPFAKGHTPNYAVSPWTLQTKHHCQDRIHASTLAGQPCGTAQTMKHANCQYQPVLLFIWKKEQATVIVLGNCRAMDRTTVYNSNQMKVSNTVISNFCANDIICQCPESGKQDYRTTHILPTLWLCPFFNTYMPADKVPWHDSTLPTLVPPKVYM